MIERHFIEQGMKRLELEDYLRAELERAGFTKSEIEKTPLVTRIVLNVTRPGLAIGKGGATIKQLTETLEKRFKIDNPQLEIREITSPELNAKAMANRMKALIERGYTWRSVAYRSVRDIMAAGAQGVEILLSGKLAGKGGRKRKQRIAEGYMKKVGEQTRLVDYAKAAAYPKAGAIGIKVRIVRPGTVFPDKVDFMKILGDREEAVDKAKKEAEKRANENAKSEIKDAGEKKDEKPKAGEKEAEKPAKEKAKEEKPEAKAEAKPVVKAEIKKDDKQVEEKPVEKPAEKKTEEKAKPVEKKAEPKKDEKKDESKGEKK
ncbi:30S ribosomal protein S3 [Candidatus Micrarchaeota archaeon]|nr:30S ribosomal protein S3 [Candidatus Micrarchaeota archaeon]